MITETTIQKCKACQQLGIRVMDGYFTNGQARWRSPQGELWNGKTCPTCNRERSKNNMRKKRGSDGT